MSRSTFVSQQLRVTCDCKPTILCKQAQYFTPSSACVRVLELASSIERHSAPLPALSAAGWPRLTARPRWFFLLIDINGPNPTVPSVDVEQPTGGNCLLASPSSPSTQHSVPRRIIPTYFYNDEQACLRGRCAGVGLLPGTPKMGAGWRARRHLGSTAYPRGRRDPDTTLRASGHGNRLLVSGLYAATVVLDLSTAYQQHLSQGLLLCCCAVGQTCCWLGTSPMINLQSGVWTSYPAVAALQEGSQLARVPTAWTSG